MDNMNAFIRGFLKGFFLPVSGGRLLLRLKGARRWAILPLIVNVIVYALVVVMAFWLIDIVKIPQVSWEFAWGLGGYLADAVNYLAPILKWVVCVPLVATVCYFSFTFVGMLVATPFNDILSEKIEYALTTGNFEAEFELRMTVRAFFISMYSTMRFFGKQVFYSILCLPLLFIPFVGMILLFLVSSYYAGIGFLDIGMARNYLGYKHKMGAVRGYRWEVLGLGAAMELGFLIPLVGLVLLPLGVAGGTLLYCDIDWNKVLADNGYAPPAGFNPPVKKRD